MGGEDSSIDNRVIEVADVTKEFGDKVALDSCSFTVDRGRIVGLLGPNGAGKTTLLRIILGLTSAHGGSAKVLGQPAGHLVGQDRRIGTTMDDIGPLPGAKGKTELAIWARRIGATSERIEKVADLVGLKPKDLARKIGKYSTGMRKRHSLAVALLSDPEILILDEPASGLDPEGVFWLRETLRGLADQGRTILVSSHTLSEVELVADDIVILQQTIRFAGPIESLVDDHSSLEDGYLNLVSNEQRVQKS